MKTQARATEQVKILLSLQDSMGNRSTLRCTSDDFGAMQYQLYGSWNTSGTPLALSNLGTKGTQPVTIDAHDTIQSLVKAISEWVESGYVNVAEVRFAKAIKVTS